MTSVKKSESHDGKPVFSKTLEGQNIERKFLFVGSSRVGVVVELVGTVNYRFSLTLVNCQFENVIYRRV